MKKNFLVINEDELYVFVNELKIRIATPPAGITIPAAMQTAIIAACDALIANINAVKKLEDAYHAAVAVKKETKKSQLKVIREAVLDIKRLAGFNESIAKALGIDGVEVTADYANMKPEGIKLKKVLKGIEIRYTRSIADGVCIYCKRGNETDFTFVNKINKTTFTDTRPNLDGAAAEKREYYLVYFKDDEEIGMESEIFTIKG